MEQKKNYALPIVMMIALFAMISFVTGLASPIALIAKGQFLLSDAQSQYGNFANFLAYAFMGIPAGLLIKRVGYKKTALLAILVGLVGVAIQFLSGIVAGDVTGNVSSPGFIVYLLGAFVAGFSMCMLNAVVNPMLNTLGGGGKKGNRLIQLGGSLNSLSATITPVFVGYLMGTVLNPVIKDANPALFTAMGVFVLVFIVLALVRIPEPHLEAKSTGRAEKSKHGPLSFRHFVLGAISIFIYVGVEVGIPMFILLYMTKGLGLAATVAGSVAGTYWFLMLIGRFIGVAIGGKVSSRAMTSTAASLGVILVCVALLTLPDTKNIVTEQKETIEMTSTQDGVSATVVEEEALALQEGNSNMGDNAIRMPVFKSDKGTLSFGTEMVPFGILLLVLCGLCTSVMWGGIFNLATEGLGKYIPMASGIFMVMVCGGGILPLIQGFVADGWGYVASYWVVLAGLLYILFYALVGSKNVNKNIPVK